MASDEETLPEFRENLILPLVVYRGKKMFPVDDQWKPQRLDRVRLAVFGEGLKDAREWLTRRGWRAVDA